MTSECDAHERKQTRRRHCCWYAHAPPPLACWHAVYMTRGDNGRNRTGKSVKRRVVRVLLSYQRDSAAFVMGTRTQQMHEFLSGYLGPSSGPPTFGVPNQPLNARLPVSPGEGIPGGIRPIPTSSQSNKKTNAQIPYVRLVYSAKGTAGLRAAPQEGDIVLVEQTTLYRKDAGDRLGHGTNSYAYTRTIESLNAENELLSEPRDEAYTYDTFPYRLDGVINNVDSEDPQKRVQGLHHCQRGHLRARAGSTTVRRHGATSRRPTLDRSCTWDSRPSKWGGKFTHRLVRFSSAQLSRGRARARGPRPHAGVCVDLGDAHGLQPVQEHGDGARQCVADTRNRLAGNGGGPAEAQVGHSQAATTERFATTRQCSPKRELALECVRARVCACVCVCVRVCVRACVCTRRLKLIRMRARAR